MLSGGNTTLTSVQAGTDTIATTNEIYEWINPLYHAEVIALTNYIATNN